MSYPFPYWRNGQPVNLTAAAADALAWLYTCRRALDGCGSFEELARLDRCIANLAAQVEPLMPDQPCQPTPVTREE